MKLLFVVNNFNIGGPQKSLLSLLHYFPKNINVDLIVLNGDYRLAEYLPHNVSIVPTPPTYKLLMLTKNKLGKNLFLGMWTNPKLTFKALTFIVKSIFWKDKLTKKKQQFWNENKELINTSFHKKYDVAVGVSGGHSVMFISDYIKSTKKVGWIRTEYQNLERDLEIDSVYFKEMDIILSVSEKCTLKFKEIFPSYKSDIYTFYNALPFRMYNNLEEDSSETLTKNVYTISTISRLDEGKGLELVIESAKILSDKNFEFEWNIYGTGQLKRTIEKKIKDYGLDKRVFLKGFVFNTGEVLKATDLLVHPSYFEGKSNTIDEAKFYRLPIISTNFPTVTEQLENGYSGVIVGFDPKEISNSIERVLEDNELIKRLNENLLQYTKDIKGRNPYKEFINIIKEN